MIEDLADTKPADMRMAFIVHQGGNIQRGLGRRELRLKTSTVFTEGLWDGAEDGVVPNGQILTLLPMSALPRRGDQNSLCRSMHHGNHSLNSLITRWYYLSTVVAVAVM
jgi:hypothetical protein